MEAFLAIELIGRVRGILPGTGRDEPDRAPGADVRQHRGAGARVGGRRKRGQHKEALGRSRGGFSCKIHLKTDFRGLPLSFHLTGGEVSDSTQLPTSLDIGPDIQPRAALTDKGYDAQANRAACRARGIVPVIPHRANARKRPMFFPKLLYKEPCPHRAGDRQTQALQAHRPTLRKDGRELRLPRRICLRHHLGQIRPHGLGKLKQHFGGVIHAHHIRSGPDHVQSTDFVIMFEPTER